MSTATRGPGSEALRLPDAPLGAAVGNAVTAARLAAAGVDVIIAYHSSPLRNRGLPSVSGLLPWGNANDMTLRILPEVTAAVPRHPDFPASGRRTRRARHEWLGLLRRRMGRRPDRHRRRSLHQRPARPVHRGCGTAPASTRTQQRRAATMPREITPSRTDVHASGVRPAPGNSM
jgi:hypothetical protein